MSKKNRLLLYGIILLTVLSVLVIQKSKPKENKITLTDCLDTVCEITAFTNKPSVLNNCADYIRKMDAELDAEDSSSNLFKFNCGENVSFSGDAQKVIDFGKSFSKNNSDYFSVYLNPVIKAWDITNNTGTIPDLTAAINEFKNENSINLGAVAKGYITDRLAEILKSGGINSAMINLGGNAYALGKKPTGENWKIGIQDPKNENELIGVITAENLAVITSGDYQRYFEKDGVRYHHIIDPKTCHPAQSGLHSVTIISENAALADCLSTAIFVAGVEKGKELLKKYDVRGIFVTDDTVYFSKSLENIFRQSTFAYKYEFIY